MPRKLKVWNGYLMFHRDNERKPLPGGRSCQLHTSVCAYSQKDAVELIREYGFRHMSLHEFRDYWSPCWGYSMAGIEPERGIWAEFERGKPVRLIKEIYNAL